MKINRTNIFIKVVVVITYVIMIGVNWLANSIPINGVTTGQVSASYPNLFAPAPYTFAIWGLIYILLAAYTIYQFGIFNKYENNAKDDLISKIGVYFSISSIANAIWIICWHYYAIPSTMLLMIVMLICLILIAFEIDKNPSLSARDKLFIKLPFSVYFGWITIATIANVTTLLVSLGWNGFGISEEIWTAIIVIVGLIISVATIKKFKSISYGLVIVWAYVGILVNHISAKGFDGQYPIVIVTVFASIILLLFTVVKLIFDVRRT